VKHTEKLAPVAAVVSAISCIACCLPIGFAAAAGIAGVGESTHGSVGRIIMHIGCRQDDGVRHTHCGPPSGG